MFLNFKLWRKFSYQKDRHLFTYLKNLLGFKPVDINLYRLAFTHSSILSVDKNNNPLNNERLEYLGDAILDSIISDYLYLSYPKEQEGFLTTMRSKIVNRASLEEIAKQINLDRFLNSHLSGTGKNHLLGNAFEALIGAIYLDRGYNKTKLFIENIIINNYIDLEALINIESNPKSKLIEICQKNKIKLQFKTFQSTVHKNTFLCEIFANEKLIGTGRGLNKKTAEQDASIPALDRLNSNIV